MTNGARNENVHTRAGWLPAGQEELEAWLAGHAERVAARGDDVEPHPVIAEFQRLIDADPVVRMYLERMIEEAPASRDYSRRHLESVPQLLRLIDELLTMAPEFSEDGSVVTPLGAILDWTMGTTAGFAAYRDPRVNAMLKKVLTAWCDFLTSPASLYVLNDFPTGWKNPAAAATMGMDDYQHDPGDEHWGFTSWNDFFTRRFEDGRRPVAAPDDDRVVVSPCESTPYGISTDVRLQDQFWVKSQPYSLHDLLAGDASAEQFAGGTVYQAYLSATNYHRWHSPVSGTIVRAFVVDGTYYSEADSEGADAIEPKNSQAYLAHVATRAVIVIQADDPAIGEVAFVPVGMVEVSSCVIGAHVTPGAHVTKGDELGYFQYGGSTFCLVFRPGVVSGFALAAIPQPGDPRAPLVRVRSELATLAPPRR